jgi:hypothetical protein
MITYNSLEGIKNYRDHPNLSQTDLKNLISSKKPFKESLSSLLGSYLDSLLLLTKEDFESLWVISDVKRPTETIVDLCDRFREYVKEVSPNLEGYRQEIKEWIIFTDYYSNRKVDSRTDTFIKEAFDWWNVLVDLGEKRMITSAEATRFELIRDDLMSDPEFSKWLEDGWFQKDFYWDENGVGCKGLADIVREKSNRVALMDLKYTTCTSLREWIKVCISLGYPFQMAFYKRGLEVTMKKGVDCFWMVIGDGWKEVIKIPKEIVNIGKTGYYRKDVIYPGNVEKKY